MAKPAAVADVAADVVAPETAAPAVAVVAAPLTFAQRIAAIDAQLAVEGLYDVVKDALVKARSQEIKKEIKALHIQLKAARAMLPKVERKPRKAK